MKNLKKIRFSHIYMFVLTIALIFFELSSLLAE